MFNSAACLLVDRAGLCTNACLTLSGVPTTCCSELIYPQKDRVTTRNRSVATNVEMRQKSRWVTETDSPLLTNAPYTNTQCSTGQVSTATEVVNQRKRMPTTSSPPLGLPTEYYPFKRCQVPVGHHLYTVYSRI